LDAYDLACLVVSRKKQEKYFRSFLIEHKADNIALQAFEALANKETKRAFPFAEYGPKLQC